MAKKNSPLRRPSGKGTPAQTDNRLGLLGLTAELIDILSPHDMPADALLSGFFKQRSFLGARDRSVLAEAAYCWLRFKYRINHLAASGDGSPVIRKAKMALFLSGAPEEIWSKGRKEDNGWLSRVINLSPNDLPQEPRTCLPNWLMQRLVDQFGAEQAALFAVSVQVAAPLDLRVNSVKADLSAVQAGLAEEGIATSPIAGLPLALRVDGKPSLNRTTLFDQGAFEVQDAGSQWVSRLVAPRRSDLVIDFCAGAGGKTLAIGALMRNTGRILAVDTSERRLQKFKPRAARSGLSNFATMLINDENDPRLQKYFAKADRVITDVPCTGMGTLRRNPDLKFRQNERSVAEMIEKQRSIIRAASKLVKPDGRLVYVTCSVLKEENEEVVEAFLAENQDFRLRRWTEVLGPDERPDGADTQTDVLRLWPHQTNTDGFFAAVLQKDKS